MAGKSGRPIGTIFAEVGLDYEPYSRAQKRLLKDATSTTLNIEANFKKLGIKSSAEMDLMRAKITNSFNMIKHSGQATANDIVRAEKAKTEQLKRLNDQQFGHQTSLLTKLKQNWIAVSAGIVAVWYTIGKVIRVVDDLTDAASGLGETISKSNLVFRGNANEIMKWSQNSADAMGLSQQAALENAATMGNMFAQLGAGTKIAAANSINMVQLSADIASFHNVTGGAEAVLVAMMSAFRGEYDALQRYIPTIKAASVQQQALAETGKKSAGELTELEKATAAMHIIIKDAGVATGDFARTSGELANQQRILNANIKDTKSTIGTALIPTVTQITTEINKWVTANKKLIEQRSHEAMNLIGESLKTIISMYKAYSAGPKGQGFVARILFGVITESEWFRSIKENAGTGLIARILFGEGAGKIESGPFFRGEIPIRPTVTPTETITPTGLTDAQKKQLDIDYKYTLEQYSRILDAADAFYGDLKVKGDLSLAEIERQKKEEHDLIDKELDYYFSQYARQLDAAEAMYSDIGEAAKEANKTILDLDKETKNDMLDAMKGWASGWSSTLNDMLWGAQITFKDIVISFGKMLTQMMIQKKIVEPFFKSMESGKGAGIFSSIASWLGFSKGAILDQNKVTPFASGTVLTKPAIFPMANGMGLAGERGPEGILPLKRNTKGELGVINAGEKTQGRGGVTVIMNNPVFQDLETQQKVFEQIAAVIAYRVAPGAVIQSYDNGEQIRDVIRGRY